MDQERTVVVTNSLILANSASNDRKVSRDRFRFGMGALQTKNHYARS